MNDYIIIGSVAAGYHAGNRNPTSRDYDLPDPSSSEMATLKSWKRPKDLDIILPEKSRHNSPVIDVPMSLRHLNLDMHYMPDHIYEYLDNFHTNNGSQVLNMSGLYNLKLSHSMWDISWLKTVQDMITMKKVFYLSPDKKLVQMLMEFWDEYHADKKKNINLNQPADEFFNENVNRHFDHDMIHEAIAYYGEPLHNRIKKDGHEVLCDKDKFYEDLSHFDRLKLCREEIYTIALERYMIPNSFCNDKYHPRVAYENALKALVTRMSKGWFPYFIMENIETLISPDADYCIRFLEYIQQRGIAQNDYK